MISSERQNLFLSYSATLLSDNLSALQKALVFRSFGNKDELSFDAVRLHLKIKSEKV